MSRSSTHSLANAHTILVVDDSDDIRLMTRVMLEAHGYQVSEASNGKEAVEIARSACPSLILMDLNMPVMDGLTATEQIRRHREECKEVPILATTANESSHMKKAALEAGCDGYINKPFDFDKLITILRSVLNC